MSMRLHLEAWGGIITVIVSNRQLLSAPSDLCRVEFARSGTLNNDIITVPVEIVPGTTWYLDIQLKSGSWRPPWELPLLIVLPFVLLVLAILFLVARVHRSMHMRLVYSLLPKDDCNVMETGSSFNSLSSNIGGRDSPNTAAGGTSMFAKFTIGIFSKREARLSGLITTGSGGYTMKSAAERLLTVVGQL